MTRDELLAAGVTIAQLRHRREIGYLIPEYRGVYRVGHRAPNFETSYMAAVKARGKGALLGGMAATYLFALIKGRPPPPEVTSPTERLGARYSPSICRHDATRWRGIPVTTVPRTLIDIAPRMSEGRLLLPNTPGAGKLRRSCAATPRCC